MYVSSLDMPKINLLHQQQYNGSRRDITSFKFHCGMLLAFAALGNSLFPEKECYNERAIQFSVGCLPQSSLDGRQYLRPEHLYYRPAVHSVHDFEEYRTKVTNNCLKQLVTEV